MIGWLTVEAAGVPPGEDWLCGGEAAILETLRFVARRDDWLAGRWAAKSAVSALLGISPRHVEVRADGGGVPHALQRGDGLPVAVSISHRDGVAVCAVASPAQAVGCDLELVEPRASGFAVDWFTTAESAACDAAAGEGGSERDLLVTVLWSAKESALKVLGTGLRRDTRSVEVTPTGDAVVEGWQPLRVGAVEGTSMTGWWRREGRLVLSTVSAGPFDAPPVRLPLASACR